MFWPPALPWISAAAASLTQACPLLLSGLGCRTQIQIDPPLEIEVERAVRVDVCVDQRREPAIILPRHARRPNRLRQHTRHHQGVDVDKAALKEVQRQHRNLLVLKPVRDHLAALAEEDEPVGAVPVLHDVEAFVALAPKGLRAGIAAQEDRLDRLAGLGKRLVSRVLHARAKRRRITSGSAVRWRKAAAYLIISSYCRLMRSQSMARVRIGARLGNRPPIL